MSDPTIAGWARSPISAFDLETTGRDPLSARIVAGSILRVEGEEVTAREWLLDPEIEIPAEAEQVHGISTERAGAEGQDYRDGYREIRDELERDWANGRIIAIYNAVYDLTVIDAEGRRLGYPPLVVGPVVDPYVIDREFDRYRKGKRILSVTCRHYGITLGDAAHTAAADGLAAARLATILARKHAELAALTAVDLMAAQAEWHRTRQDDFARYLERTGKDSSDVYGDWPMRRPA